MPKPVALIVLNWNTPEHTSGCIRSLLAFCNPELFDIIVLDNGSTDNSLLTLSGNFPDLIFIDNKENLGFAEGVNRGLEYSISEGYRFSLILNPDTKVDEDIVGKMYNYLISRPKIAAVQPVIYYLNNRHKIWNAGSYFNSMFGFTYSIHEGKTKVILPGPPKPVEWLTGCCFLIQNEVLKRSGLFNKQFFLYYEDVDLSFRLRSLGYELHLLPEVKIYHEAGVSGKSKIKRKEGIINPVIHYYNFRNRIWFLRKYANPYFYPLIWTYHSMYTTSVLAYFLLRQRWQKALYLLKGVKDGLFTSRDQIWRQ